MKTEEVYKAATVSWIKRYARLDILKLCVLRSSSSNLEMPSWVPDFSFQDVPEVILYTQADGYAEAFHSFEEANVLAVHGVKVARIKQVLASTFTKESTDKELVDGCRTWGSQLHRSTAYLGGDSMEDEFIDAVMCGRAKEMAPSNYGALPTTKDCKDILLGTEDLDEGRGKKSIFANIELVCYNLRSSVVGRAAFRTEEGHVGVCPESTKDGDVVVVMLGCPAPFVLRPDQKGSDTFQMVGECYVPGIMNAETLLGPVPPGWAKKNSMSTARRPLIIYEQGSIRTQQDQRVSSLPSGWRFMFGTYDNPLEVEPEDERDWVQIWFKNSETGEQSVYDPRLTPELLRERLVDIREFKIV